MRPLFEALYYSHVERAPFAFIWYKCLLNVNFAYINMQGGCLISAGTHFAILLSYAKIAKINTLKNMSWPIWKETLHGLLCFWLYTVRLLRSHAACQPGVLSTCNTPGLFKLCWDATNGPKLPVHVRCHICSLLC